MIMPRLPSSLPILALTQILLAVQVHGVTERCLPGPCIYTFDESCESVLARTMNWQYDDDDCCSLQDNIEYVMTSVPMAIEKCDLVIQGNCGFSYYERSECKGGNIIDSATFDDVEASVHCVPNIISISSSGPEMISVPKPIDPNSPNDTLPEYEMVSVAPLECPPSTYDPKASLIYQDATPSPSLAASDNTSPSETVSDNSTNLENDLDFAIMQVGGCDINNHVSEGAARAITEEKEARTIRNCVRCAATVEEQTTILQSMASGEEDYLLCDFGFKVLPVRGLILSVSSAARLTPLIDQVVDQIGIPVVTFESDAPESKRVAYVGTNNTFMGDQIAKNVHQILPEGGTYAIFASDSDSDKNRERIEAFETRLADEGGWAPAEGSPLFVTLQQDNFTQHVHGFLEMQTVLENNPTVVVPMEFSYMESRFWEELVDENRFRNITYVSGDGTPVQISYLLRDYAQGLVGQVPYEMGYEAVRVVLDVLLRNKVPEKDIIGTNVISHTKIPYVLPELVMDYNLIEGLKYIGYICFGMVALCSVAVSVWTYKFREVYVVKASQPIFLIMISSGVFILSSSILPLSMDDEDHLFSSEDEHSSYATAVCMGVPWLACTGFAITFAAMFSKTWRINKLMNNNSNFRRVQVKEKDVLVPFFALLLANIIVLVPWTIVDPLMYERNDFSGTDGWNRVIASYGACRSNNPTPFLAALLVINMGVLIVANWQAYRARHLESEFAESKFIALTMASLFQASLLGLPTLFLVRDNPPAFYLLLVFLIFVLCMVILLLVFLPKILAAYSFSHMTRAEQTTFMRERVRMSSKGGSTKNSSGPISGLSGDMMTGSFHDFPSKRGRETGETMAGQEKAPPVRINENVTAIPEH
uniref:G-protein coupled receptors family 3 profile domain-containing protein n=2 Tax=Amphora coffeiformis TaxID=265554 RepID=A0A7S3KY73_9STRA